MSNHRTLHLIGTAAAVSAAAASGSVASRAVDSTWYRHLDKPPIQPPALAFPIVWTTLYADLAIVCGRASADLRATGRQHEARRYRRALAANLVLNAGWSWVFFRGHRLAAATAVAGLLTASSADLVRRTAVVSPRGAAALAPYPVWCGFATVLSDAIRRRNH